MASGSSGRTTNSASKGFDFASDDILCSYEDYGNRDANTEIHSDPSNAKNSAADFHKNRMMRAPVFPTATYGPPEESSFNQEVISTVESTMKKSTDNLMRFLEGIGARLSQLELYCYNLDKSIGEMRSDLVHGHGESETRLKNLEKHIQEVHRSVQILRDKQELVDAQKELAKLQLAHKESSSPANTQQNNESVSTPSEAKTSEASSDSHDRQLALVPHQQVPQPVEHHPTPPPMPSQNMVPEHAAYYVHSSQFTSIPAPSFPPSQTQYFQDPSRVSGPHLPPHAQQVHPYPSQWAQQPGQPSQQAVVQPQIRSSNQLGYLNYLPSQAAQSPTEIASNNSMPMQVPPVASQPDSGYAAAAGRQQHVKSGYGGGAQTGHGYRPVEPHPSQAQGNAYALYENEGGRMHQPPAPAQPQYQQSVYPPTSIPSNPNNGVPHSIRDHPYRELVEKLVSMGYRCEHVVGVIQRLEGSGQAIDFNSVLDRLNGQRGWSG